MKNGAARVVLIAFSLACATAAYAQETADSKLSEQRSKQESIYRSQGEQTVEGYTVDRTLSVYAQGLSSEFERTLSSLGPDDRWLDIGAGQARAVLDYFRRRLSLAQSAKAQAVAMSIEDRRTPLWQETAARLGANQIQYLFGKRLGQYSLEELGKFQLITDVMGGFSYTENIATFMQKVLALLELNGSFFTVLQDVQWEDGTNKPFYAGSPFLTEIVAADGAGMKMCGWLKRIGCVEVTCESRPNWQPPVEAYHVKKVCDDATVPPVSLVHFQAGTPPERRFELGTR